MNKLPVYQRGVALITTLLVTAMAVIASVSMITNQQMDIHRTGNLIVMDQAYTYAQGLEEWARIILLKDQRDNNKDHLYEFWATSLPPLPVDGGYVQGSISDLHACLNLNAVVKNNEMDELNVGRLNRLLEILEVDTALISTLADWIDQDIDTLLEGAEDDYYLSLERPYRSANQPLVSISELRLIKGFSKAVMKKITPYVCVLPENGVRININTASSVVLQSLFKGVTESDANALIEARGEDGFASVEKFLEHDVLAGREGLSTAGLGLVSRYFRVSAEAYIGDGVTRLYSVVQRSVDKNKSPTILRHSLGVKD